MSTRDSCCFASRRAGAINRVRGAALEKLRLPMRLPENQDRIAELVRTVAHRFELRVGACEHAIVVERPQYLVVAFFGSVRAREQRIDESH